MIAEKVKEILRLGPLNADQVNVIQAQALLLILHGYLNLT